MKRSGTSEPMQRREFLRLTALSGAALAVGGALAGRGEGETAGWSPPSFEFDEATIDDLARAQATGSHSAHDLAQAYLSRIEAIDRRGADLGSVIELNPDALSLAAELDRERKEKGPRGPLHGIPILVKDNIETGDRMATSAGSLALAENRAADDAPLVRRLRAAGAVILGKTNLSEWANFRSTHSTSGWSGRGGQTRNPYALDRNPCGSSSGSGAAIAANLAAVAVGTETDGSIVCPSSTCGLVGLKPTVGLVSRSGVIPISHTQDTPGPMGRTVRDVAILLGAMAGPDPHDAATRGPGARWEADYTKGLDGGALKGLRLGVARKYFGFSSAVDGVMKESIEALKRGGAVIVDPVDLPTSSDYDPSELEVLLYEFKADLNVYLGGTGKDVRARTLADLIRWNDEHKEREMPFFGQELFHQAQEKGPLTAPAYRKALAKCRRHARTLGIDAHMAKHRLDALVAPSNGPAWVTDFVNGDHYTGGSSTPAAVAGYPSLTVPAGTVFGLPVGITFFGRPWSEAKLLRIGHAFERATKARRKPGFVAALSER